MTRADYIRSLSDEQLAVFLCDFNPDTCGTCAAADYCYPHHNGMKEWLQENIEKERSDY